MINKCEIGHRSLIAASWQLTSLLEKLWVVVGEGQVLLTGYQVKAFFFLGVWPHLARQQGQLHRGPVYLCEVGVEDIHVTLWASQALRPLLPNLLMGTVILYQFVSPSPAPQGCGAWAKTRLEALGPILPFTGCLQQHGSRFGGQS